MARVKMKLHVDRRLDFPTSTRALLSTLTEAGNTVRLTSLSGGMGGVGPLWARHVDETEGRLFPGLIAAEPAANGPVDFCLAEHATLSARLRELESTRPTPEWIRDAEGLIGRLIQHLFVEARLLRPLLDRMGPGDFPDCTHDDLQGRRAP